MIDGVEWLGSQWCGTVGQGPAGRGLAGHGSVGYGWERSGSAGHATAWLGEIWNGSTRQGMAGTGVVLDGRGQARQGTASHASDRQQSAPGLDPRADGTGDRYRPIGE